jgi:hypothetical protein
MATLARETAGQKHLDASSDDDVADAATPIRRSGESSPTESIYDDPILDAKSGPGRQVVKEYSLYRNRLSRDIALVPGSISTKEANPATDAVFFADYAPAISGKPNLTLRLGPSKDGSQVLGVCRFGVGAGAYVVGISDPINGNDSQVQWEKMKRHGILNTREWTISIPVGDKRQNFSWKSTHDKSVGAGKSFRNKKLIDEETGEVVAVFLVNGLKSWKKMGKLTLYKDSGENWETIVLLTLLGLIERTRRVSQAA